jgi:hypothetical protein
VEFKTNDGRGTENFTHGRRRRTMPNKTLDLIINQPPAGLFTAQAQEIVAVGITCFLILWGFAKIAGAIRGKN